MKKTLLVIGSGALACYYAHRIAQAGYPVGMLSGWSDSINRISREGVEVIDPSGKSSNIQVQISKDPEDFSGVETVLVLVKSWQTHRAAKQLRSCLAPNGVCLTLQNGLGNEKVLADYLGSSRVSVGTTVIGARLLEPGIVKISGIGRINLEDSPKIKPFLRIFEDADLEVRISQDVFGLQWEKLIVNAAVNPLTVLLECKNGVLLENQDSLDLIEFLVNETSQVAKALGIKLSFDNSLKFVLEVIGQTGKNISSLFQDYSRGAPTEIDTINGAVIRYGEAAGVSVPYNKMILKMVKAKLALRNQKNLPNVDEENKVND
jgi:2-dehydropantoate 2-reductase